MMSYVLIPGAWAGDWVWDAVATRLRQFGHEVHQLTLPGLENSDNAKEVRLADHVHVVVDHIESRNLNEVILVGHSYSGIVVGQASTQIPQRVAHIVFVEAFLPVDGKSLLEISGLDAAHEKKLIEENGGLWPAPALEELKSQPHLSDTLIDLLAAKQKDHPGKTVTDPATLARPLTMLRATFISGEGWLSSTREVDLIETLQRHENWDFKTIEGGHWPMLTMPDELATLLHGIRA
ncbi:MAG: alpha/beta hydrolase [Anaerolineaceae bacterium]|jgi:pimeloyl-ACP methyl ester carboxylesterase